LEYIKSIKVDIPDKSTQHCIATVLSTLDRKIALNNRINAELERTARMVYGYMFLQGERGNWKSEKLSETSLCSLIKTGVDRFDGEKIYLSTSEVSGTDITDHAITVDYGTRPSRANMQPQMHSVWFAKMKNTVKHLLVNEENALLTANYLLSTGFAGLKCKPSTLYYLWNYLRGDHFESQKDILATGATQQAINDGDLAGFSIRVPPQAELDKFTKIVEPYYRLINKLKFENKALAEHRDFLLPLLMNGQVRVGA
jgi:type I restriction enzyme S subunit